MLKKILGVAREEIGYLEKASNKDLEIKQANAGSNNYTKYGKWYDEYHKTSGFVAQAWCAMFVCWCAMKSGIADGIIPYTASCKTGSNWFRQRGLWHDRSGYVPKPGDVIYYSWSGSTSSVDHVGLVEKVENGRVYTIEGNTSAGTTLVPNGGCVASKNYALTYTCILGYGTPKYVTLEEDEDMTQDTFNKLLVNALSSKEVASALVNAVASSVNAPTYKTRNDVPNWGVGVVDKLIKLGILQGDGKGNLDISLDLLRTMVLNDRLGLYDIKSELIQDDGSVG